MERVSHELRMSPDTDAQLVLRGPAPPQKNLEKSCLTQVVYYYTNTPEL